MLSSLLGHQSYMSDMDSMVVECDIDEKLILEVEKHMCLYDPNRGDYKDQTKKALAWKMVAAVMGWDVLKATKRFKSLRDVYIRKKKKISSSRRGDAAMMKSRWKYADIMSFLDPFCRQQRPELLEGNYLLPCKIEEDTDMDDSSGRQSPLDPLPVIPTPTPAELVTLETGSCERQAGSLSRKRRAESPDSQALDILKQTLESSIHRREIPPRDENMIWAESLGMRLQKMTPRQRAFVRAKVEQLMFDVEFAPAPDMPQNWEERFGCEGPTD